MHRCMGGWLVGCIGGYLLRQIVTYEAGTGVVYNLDKCQFPKNIIMYINIEMKVVRSPKLVNRDWCKVSS